VPTALVLRDVGVLELSANRRTALRAGAVFALVSAVAALFAPRELFGSHTTGNHFALLAEGWSAGKLDLGGAPPAYTGNNDFARFDGRYFVAFPPFPAVLIWPWLRCFGSAEHTPDGLFFVLLAGVAPACLFLALEKLTRIGESLRSTQENLLLALAFAFGSVYFFSAVQGTVWFAAHVVGTALCALYLLFALRADYPIAAGVALALGFATRTPLLFAAPLFVIEAVRRSRGLNRDLMSRLVRFAVPIVLVLALTAWHNFARFGDAFEVGYRYLDIAWQARIQRWGLFSYHYLARNLGVVLTSLPFVPGERGAPFSINLHGLALWFTTPLYLLLPWPARRARVTLGLALSAAAVALPSLLYQNTGWLQFGYRFSNDYAPLLFALIAVGARSLRGVGTLLLAWSLLINGFGAASFGRPAFARYYFFERTQSVLYQPD